MGNWLVVKRVELMTFTLKWQILTDLSSVGLIRQDSTWYNNVEKRQLPEIRLQILASLVVSSLNQFVIGMYFAPLTWTMLLSDWVGVLGEAEKFYYSSNNISSGGQLSGGMSLCIQKAPMGFINLGNLWYRQDVRLFIRGLICTVAVGSIPYESEKGRHR